MSNRVFNFDEFLFELKQEDLDIKTTNQLSKAVKLDYEAFVKRLGTDAKDPKFIAAVKAGRWDGSKDDEKLEFEAPKFVSVKQLIPTQNEIDMSKSASYQLSGKDPNTKNILEGKSVTIVSPIVILDNKYVIDGHHRWSQVYLMNPDAKIEVMNINSKKKVGPITILKAVQMSIAAATGKVPTAKVEGKNLMVVPEKECKEYLTEHISDVTLDLMKETKKAEDKESAVEYIWKNIEEMRAHNAPIENAPSRDVMPQTDTDSSDKWKKRLEAGKINYLPKYRVEKETEIKKPVE